jgi:uncharacterized membrane protein YdjX (TVP38/TMEM64 family)
MGRGPLRRLNQPPGTAFYASNPSMKKIILVVSLLVLVLLFFLFDLEQYLTLEYVKSQQQAIQAHYADNRVATLIGFFIIYVVVTGASLPGATVLTLVAGAIFGLPTALLLVSFASTIGASIAFLVSRYLFRDAVQSRFGGSLKAINDGIDKDGPFYLFALRLVPAFPFFVINLVMGLTSLRLWTFFWVSQIGTAVFSVPESWFRSCCWRCCHSSGARRSR